MSRLLCANVSMFKHFIHIRQFVSLLPRVCLAYESRFSGGSGEAFVLVRLSVACNSHVVLLEQGLMRVHWMIFVVVVLFCGRSVCVLV